MKNPILNLYERAGNFLVSRHKFVQLVCYEPSNGLLIAKNYADTGQWFGNMQNVVTAAACLVGSSMIWALENPKWKDKAWLLFYGALSLTAGGIAIAANGGPQIVTGTATAVASLETARGAAQWMQGTMPEERTKGQQTNYLLSKIFMNTYGRLMEHLFDKIPALDHVFEERPFVTGSMIKLASRAFYLYAMRDSPLGFAIGCMWAVGDAALACLDDKLKEQWYRRHPGKTSVAPGRLEAA